MDDASIEDIAKRCGLSPATWRTWERGSSPHKMAKVVEEIARATGVNMVWLMWGPTPEMPDGGPAVLINLGGDDTHPDLPTAQSRCTAQVVPLKVAA